MRNLNELKKEVDDYKLFKLEFAAFEAQIQEAKSEDDASIIFGEYIGNVVMPRFVKKRVYSQIVDMIDKEEEEKESVPLEVIEHFIESVHQTIEMKENYVRELLAMAAIAVSES